LQKDDVGDLSHGEEVAVASGVEEESERELGSSGDRRGKKRKSGSGSNVEDGNEQEKESGVRKVALDVDDDEDAICKRTRARYSLASFTLDELETFLQESDDEDDLPNVDDEVECRKFLLRLFCLVEMVMVSQIKRSVKMLMMKMRIMMWILRLNLKSCLTVMLMMVQGMRVRD
jgi:hypothetical protein